MKGKQRDKKANYRSKWIDIFRPMNSSLWAGKYRYDYLARCGSAMDTEERPDIYLDTFPNGPTTCSSFARYTPKSLNKV